MPLIPQNILDCMTPEDRRRYAKGQYTVQEIYERAAISDERKEHKRFISWLNRRDLDYTHCRMDKRTTIKVGTPDFHVWRGERHCFVEFKSEFGKLSEKQKDFIARQCERGTPVLVTQSYQEAAEFVVQTLGLDLLINIL